MSLDKLAAALLNAQLTKLASVGKHKRKRENARRLAAGTDQDNIPTTQYTPPPPSHNNGRPVPSLARSHVRDSIDEILALIATPSERQRASAAQTVAQGSTKRLPVDATTVKIRQPVPMPPQIPVPKPVPMPPQIPAPKPVPMPPQIPAPKPVPMPPRSRLPLGRLGLAAGAATLGLGGLYAGGKALSVPGAPSGASAGSIPDWAMLGGIGGLGALGIGGYLLSRDNTKASDESDEI